MRLDKIVENQSAGIAQQEEHLICNQGVGGSSPSGGTNEIRGLGDTPQKSPTTSPTTYYLEAWGKSWRIVDPRRGWGFADQICICNRYEDALLILTLLNGGRG